MKRFVFYIWLRSKRQKIINAMTHPRIQHTLVLIPIHFYWPEISLDMHNYVTKYHQCHINKAVRLLHPMEK